MQLSEHESMDLQQGALRVLDATRGRTRVKEICNSFKGGRVEGCEARSDKEEVGTEPVGEDVKAAKG